MSEYLKESMNYLEKMESLFNLKPYKIDQSVWYFSFKNKIIMVRFRQHKNRKRFVIYNSEFGSKTKEIFDSNDFSDFEIFLKSI
jgi:hypothetical protein